SSVGLISGEGYMEPAGSGSVVAVGVISGEGEAVEAEAEGSGVVSAVGLITGEGYKEPAGSGSVSATGAIYGEGAGGKARRSGVKKKHPERASCAVPLYFLGKWKTSLN